MKEKIIFSTKFVGFLVSYFVVIIILESIFPSNVKMEVTSIVILALIVQIMVNSLAIVYLINRLRLKGIKLIIVTASIVFGMQIFMTQIETWLFIEAFPMFNTNELVKLVVGSLILFLLLSSIAFFIWRRKKVEISDIDYKSLTIGWTWKIPVLSIVYMLLYFAFGTMIAWQSEVLRNFYATSVVDINMVGFRIIQVVRGVLWVLLCIPMVLWLNSKRIEKIIVTSLLIAILPTIALLFPNPYMPGEVRLTHFVEVFLSNGLFGIILTYILTMKNKKIVLKNKIL